MIGASILLAGNATEAVAAYLREKLMGAQSQSENIYFAGITIAVLDISDEQRYTRAFMTERNIEEVGSKYDAYVDQLNLPTMVMMDCNFYSLFYRHFLSIVELVALELSQHFRGYALVLLDGADEQYALYEKGIQVKPRDINEQPE
ncbi:hypothetical protein [Hymenobacter terrestris]|uniref:Uncharacterized protein n=1 Tax=Hymenobacter terrestris TaxID=2748310 RepID=A0ABX2Q5C8_9BACT|nr:hypothetical protein [Hymenobacter terrestris]NVO86183.1 hypothetical protein [Hymenobacter terrestris]